MPTPRAELLAGRARLAAVALLLTVACFSSQLHRLGDTAASPRKVEELQTSFRARSTARLFSRLEHLSDVIGQELASADADDNADSDVPPPRSNTRAYRKWLKERKKRKLNPKKSVAGSGVVLPLEREAKHVEDAVQSSEDDLVNTVAWFVGATPEHKKKSWVYKRDCNIFSGEGCGDFDGEGQEEATIGDAVGASGNSSGASEGGEKGSAASGGVANETGQGEGGTEGASGASGSEGVATGATEGGEKGSAASGGAANETGHVAPGGEGGTSGASGGAAGGSTASGGAGVGEGARGVDTAHGGHGRREVGLWWEDGNPDTDTVNLKAVSGTGNLDDSRVPLFFREEAPDLVYEDIAEAMVKANERAVTPGSADLTAEQEAIMESIKTCSLGHSYFKDTAVLSKGNSAHVSVGIFVINLDHRRSRQKLSTAQGEPAYFLLDFLMTVTQPPGSTLWTNDTAVWETLSFRNAKEIYASSPLPDVPRTRRIQAAFFYDPDMRMYPIDNQKLEVRLQQTKHTTDEWIFVPSKELNGINRQMGDITHIPCNGHVFSEFMDGKVYSNYAFSIEARKPRWFAIITSFIPPLLMLSPVILAHTLGPMSWYPKRFMVSGISWVTLAFFYTSYLRNLPMLSYLTFFDKYIYCLYMWLFGTVVSLAILVRTFRNTTEDIEEAKNDDKVLFLSRHLRDDLLHFCMFSAFIWCIILVLLGILWVWVLPTLKITIIFAMVVFFVWLGLSYDRLHKKHIHLQHPSKGFGRTQSSEHFERLAVQKSSGRSFSWQLYCLCHKPFRILCLEECCCCFYYESAGGCCCCPDACPWGTHLDSEDEWCWPNKTGHGNADEECGHTPYPSRSAAVQHAPCPQSTMEEGGETGAEKEKTSEV